MICFKQSRAVVAKFALSGAPPPKPVGFRLSITHLEESLSPPQCRLTMYGLHLMVDHHDLQRHGNWEKVAIENG